SASTEYLPLRLTSLRTIKTYFSATMTGYQVKIVTPNLKKNRSLLWAKTYIDEAFKNAAGLILNTVFYYSN
ncbi:MAG: hypothetical protein KDD40_12165, partial [Bdellovibrionales bacterium]|nr:hypothetical protein [Bdellovibrionales bacterium]